MIKKKFRLKTGDIKKVLKEKKPFFSYWIVLYRKYNFLKRNRFWIIIWSKNVNSIVERNFFRRFFYDLISKNVSFEVENSYDYLFIVKKNKKLDKKNIESINSFEKDIKFLLKKSWFTI